MIDKQQIHNWLDAKLAGTGYELITLSVSAQNDILVEIDRLEGVDVDFCADLNRYLVEQLEAAGEDDYSLEVGSGIAHRPFQVQDAIHQECRARCGGPCCRRQEVSWSVGVGG